jgi:hypothetical protein
MFWNELVLTIVLCLFEVAVGVFTSMMLHETDVSTKLPIYICIWALLLSYLTLQFLQSFLYTRDKYYDINYANARILAAMFHDVFIYIAMFLILWHTYRINKRTIDLVSNIAKK